MTYLSRRSRVFLKKIPDDWQLIQKNCGKLRFFEDEMDQRCWTNDCFARHEYLLELINGNWRKKDVDPDETDDDSFTGSDNEEGRETVDDILSAGHGQSIGTSDASDGNSARKKRAGEGQLVETPADDSRHNEAPQSDLPIQGQDTTDSQKVKSSARDVPRNAIKRDEAFGVEDLHKTPRSSGPRKSKSLISSPFYSSRDNTGRGKFGGNHYIKSQISSKRSKPNQRMDSGNQNQSVLVDITQGGELLRKISVAVSCRSLASYGSGDSCHCSPEVVTYLNMKLTEASKEIDFLHKKVYALEQKKNAYIYKIEGDLEHYCQICRKQAESINNLKEKLRYMEEQVASLQDCACVNPCSRNCRCSRHHS